MITFTLELINIFILFRYVLGYEFRRARIPIVVKENHRLYRWFKRSFSGAEKINLLCKNQSVACQTTPRKRKGDL